MIIQVTFDHDNPIIGDYIGYPEAGSTVIKCIFNAGWPWNDVVTPYQVLISSNSKRITKPINVNNNAFTVPLSTVCKGHNIVSFYVFGFDKDNKKISAKPFNMEIYVYGFTPSVESHTFEELDERISLVEEEVPTKLDKVSDAVLNNLVSLKADGSIQDSGIHKDYVVIKDPNLVPGKVLEVGDNYKLKSTDTSIDQLVTTEWSSFPYDMIVVGEDYNHVYPSTTSIEDVIARENSSEEMTNNTIILGKGSHYVKSSNININNVAIKDTTLTNNKILYAGTNGTIKSSDIDLSNVINKTSDSLTENSLLTVNSDGKLISTNKNTNNILEKDNSLSNLKVLIYKDGKISTSGSEVISKFAIKQGLFSSGNLIISSDNETISDSDVMLSDVVQKDTNISSGKVLQINSDGRLDSTDYNLNGEKWIFTLDDGTEIIKDVLSKNNSST